jgi:hypothetical protein
MHCLHLPTLQQVVQGFSIFYRSITAQLQIHFLTFLVIIRMSYFSKVTKSSDTLYGKVNKFNFEFKLFSQKKKFAVNEKIL